jgi:hypothetical protein
MFVYILRGGGYIKFGITGNLKARFDNLNGGGVPFKLRIVAYAVLDDEVARQLEVDLLRINLPHANGEWFCDEGHSDDAFAEIMRETVANYGSHLALRVYTDSEPCAHLADGSAARKAAMGTAIATASGERQWQIFGKKDKPPRIQTAPMTKRQLQNDNKIKMMKRLEKARAQSAGSC